MVTTIQLNEDVKKALDSMKSSKQTYEQVIINLIEIADKNKREQEEENRRLYKNKNGFLDPKGRRTSS